MALVIEILKLPPSWAFILFFALIAVGIGLKLPAPPGRTSRATDAAAR
jgi:hypothetical protein